MGRLSSYSQSARRAIFWANSRAIQENAPETTTEHLLYGLLREDPQLFTLVASDNPRSASEIEDSLVAGGTASKPRARTEVLPLSEPMKEIIQVAARERKRLGHQAVGTQHLLLAVLICPEKRWRWFRRSPAAHASLARQILTDHGVRVRAVEALPEITTSLGLMLSQAYAFIKSKEYENAREILSAALSFQDSIEDEERLDWIFDSLAATWLFREKFGEQVAFFSHYLNQHPEDSRAYRARASAFWYENKTDDAIRDYSRAIELNATDILSRSGRGQVLAELGDSAAAMQDLDLALQLLDSVRARNETRHQWCTCVEAFVRRGRGIALAASGQIPEAMDEFARSIGLSPDNAWVYYSRAKVYDQQADRQRAAADYTEAVSRAEPPLTPIQSEFARRRINNISHGSNA